MNGSSDASNNIVGGGKMTEDNVEDFRWQIITIPNHPNSKLYQELLTLKVATADFKINGAYGKREQLESDIKKPVTLLTQCADQIRLRAYRARVLRNQQDFEEGLLVLGTDEARQRHSWAESVRTQSQEQFMARYRQAAAEANTELFFDPEESFK